MYVTQMKTIEELLCIPCVFFFFDYQVILGQDEYDIDYEYDIDIRIKWMRVHDNFNKNKYITVQVIRIKRTKL